MSFPILISILIGLAINNFIQSHTPKIIPIDIKINFPTLLKLSKFSDNYLTNLGNVIIVNNSVQIMICCIRKEKFQCVLPHF